MRTIAHVYDTYSEAARVVEALEAAGVPHSDISIVSGDKTASGPTVTSGDPEQGAATGAGTGATLGTVLGGGAGLLAGLGSLAIPGIGPIVAAGWLIATLTGAGVGAAAGGLLGSLTGAGVSEADAQVHAEGVERGGTLVTVRTDDAQVERVQRIIDGGSTGYVAPASDTALLATAGAPLAAVPLTTPASTFDSETGRTGVTTNPGSESATIPVTSGGSDTIKVAR